MTDVSTATAVVFFQIEEGGTVGLFMYLVHYIMPAGGCLRDIGGPTVYVGEVNIVYWRMWV